MGKILINGKFDQWDVEDGETSITIDERVICLHVGGRDGKGFEFFGGESYPESKLITNEIFETVKAAKFSKDNQLFSCVKAE